jgi:hypothetical protein
MQGRARFVMGFLQDLCTEVEQLNGPVTDATAMMEETFENFRDRTVFVERNGSLYNVLTRIYTGQYREVLFQGIPSQVQTTSIHKQMQLDNRKGITELIKSLVLFSLISDKFYFEVFPAEYDLLSLGVVLLKREGTTNKVSIGEPWAIAACIRFFEQQNYSIFINVLKPW